MASFLRLATAGCNYIMGIPGGDDTMLSYQSMSFHDALYVRRLLGLRPAPEFEEWLAREPEREWLVELATRSGCTVTYALAQAPYAPEAYKDSLLDADRNATAGLHIVPQVSSRPTAKIPPWGSRCGERAMGWAPLLPSTAHGHRSDAGGCQPAGP